MSKSFKKGEPKKHRNYEVLNMILTRKGGSHKVGEKRPKDAKHNFMKEWE